MARLDQQLVSRNLAPTRSRAQDLIRRGFVSVDGVVVTKPGFEPQQAAVVSVSEAAPRFVSRGAEKLVAALDRFGFDPAGRYAIDVGAATGGFTQVLLQRGAAGVTTVDVGHGQIHSTIAGDSRVRVREGCDARSLVAADFENEIGAIVADVSFISLEKALPCVLDLAASKAWLVALIKPQFEVGRAGVGKGGIVRDEGARAASVARISAWLEGERWDVVGTLPSPIKGSDGNQEFLIGARKTAMAAR